MRITFLRNLSFQTTEESMKEMFSTEFGAVEYARIVVDKGSGLSKGVGFVRLKEREECNRGDRRVGVFIGECSSRGGINLDEDR
jgi:hypothetical protein